MLSQQSRNHHRARRQRNDEAELEHMLHRADQAFMRLLRGQAGRYPARRLESILRQQGFLPTQHFLDRLRERAQAQGIRFDPGMFGSQLYDITGEPFYIEMIAAEYPDVNFIIPHLGSFADDWRAHRQVIDQIVRLPNVYTDTSGVKRFDYVVEAVRRAGAGKILFGSDGPWLHPALELQKIKLLRLPPHDEALVLGQNLRRLIKDVRAPPDDSAAYERVGSSEHVHQAGRERSLR